MQIALGKVVVTAAGTREKATKNGYPTAPDGAGAPLGSTAEGLRCQSFQIQALPSNTGKIHIGNAAMVKATGVGVHAILPTPADSTSGPFPSQSFSVPFAANALNLDLVYLDADVSGDGVIITLIQQ